MCHHPVARGKKDMGKKRWLVLLCVAVLSFAVVLCLGGCGGEQETAAPDEAVVADGLAEIEVKGETDLPGNFFLSFV